MDFTEVTSQFMADPATGYRTAIRFFHFIGLAMGLGGATVLDLMLLRFFVRGRITDDTYGIFAFAAKIVDMGLRLLWITGLGFLFLYALTNAELLTNPKVHAKLVIVAILTVNGFFIHQVILPSIKRQIGKTLFDGMTHTRRTIFVTSGAISATSWYVPVALGAFPQLNFHVSALTILAGYFTLIVIAALTMQSIILLLHRYVPEFHPVAAKESLPLVLRKKVLVPQPVTIQYDIDAAFQRHSSKKEANRQPLGDAPLRQRSA